MYNEGKESTCNAVSIMLYECWSFDHTCQIQLLIQGLESVWCMKNSCLKSTAAAHSSTCDIPGVWVARARALAPDLFSASHETEAKCCLSVPQVPHQMRNSQTVSLVTSKIPFLSSSSILDPSAPKQTLILHLPPKYISKCCLGFLDKLMHFNLSA